MRRYLQNTKETTRKRPQSRLADLADPACAGAGASFAFHTECCCCHLRPQQQQTFHLYRHRRHLHCSRSRTHLRFPNLFRACLISALLRNGIRGGGLLHGAIESIIIIFCMTRIWSTSTLVFASSRCWKSPPSCKVCGHLRWMYRMVAAISMLGSESHFRVS